MSNLVKVSFVVILYSILFFSIPADAQSEFSCVDTPFESDVPPNILKSKYHLFQIFGDNSLRQTNFYEDNYSGMVGWIESRLFFIRFSEFTNLPIPDPYVTGILKGLKDINWEDRIDYGIGIEWRPLKRTTVLEFTPLNWLYYIRLYAVYFKTSYLQFQSEWTWRPDNDRRFGLELYRECNLYSEQRFWQEIWADFSWRETNFYVNDFKHWVFAFVPKWGWKFFSRGALALMPYLTGELALTGRREFWQNRVLAGLGIRVMPFRKQRGTIGVFIKGVRIYIESLRVVKYLKEEAPDNTPDYDVRFGFNYTIYRW